MGNAISNNSTSITVRDFSAEDQNAIDYSAGTILNSVESANKLANRLTESNAILVYVAYWSS